MPYALRDGAAADSSLRLVPPQAWQHKETEVLPAPRPWAACVQMGVSEACPQTREHLERPVHFPGQLPLCFCLPLTAPGLRLPRQAWNVPVPRTLPSPESRRGQLWSRGSLWVWPGTGLSEPFFQN